MINLARNAISIKYGLNGLAFISVPAHVCIYPIKIHINQISESFLELMATRCHARLD